MSLKGIVYRGGRYARHHDRIRYGENYTLTREELARTNEQMAGCARGCARGCLGVCLLFFLLAWGAGLIRAYSEGIPIPFWSGYLGFLGTVFFLLFLWGAYRRACRRQLLEKAGQATAAPQPLNPPAEISIESEYRNCYCQHCNQRMEFPRHGVGMSITCPTCGASTVLYDASGG
jgi:hypothetical protein